jgi:hypothetical protein
MQVACKLHVTYVDERAASRKVTALADEYYHRLRNIVQLLASEYDSFHVCCLEDAFGAHRCPDEKQQNLKEKLASSKDETSRQDLVRALRQQVLLAQAKELECNKMLVGDNSTGLAARFVSMTAQVCHMEYQYLNQPCSDATDNDRAVVECPSHSHHPLLVHCLLHSIFTGSLCCATEQASTEPHHLRTSFVFEVDHCQMHEVRAF